MPATPESPASPQLPGRLGLYVLCTVEDEVPCTEYDLGVCAMRIGITGI